MDKKIKTVFVTGPTAVGKTSLAVDLARKYCGEIISVDSRQVYRGMDIGTGKDITEYSRGGVCVPYHLIDMVDPADEYNLSRFYSDACSAIVDINKRSVLPFLAGGTPLYLDALLKGYTLPGGKPNPQYRSFLHTKSIPELHQIFKELAPDMYASFKDKENPNRLIRGIEIATTSGEGTSSEPRGDRNVPLLDTLVIGVFFPRKSVHKRIEARLDDRLDSGMIDEVKLLHQNGLSWERLEFFGLEYRYVSLFLQGRMTYSEMRDTLLAKIRQFAKRQDIWFRKMEREGAVIHWLEGGSFAEASYLVDTFLKDGILPDPTIAISNIHYGPRSV